MGSEASKDSEGSGANEEEELIPPRDPIVYNPRKIESLDELKRGDHIRAPCKGGKANHHMIVEDSDRDSVTVSHNTGSEHGVKTGHVLHAYDDLDPQQVEVLDYKLPRGRKEYSGDEVVARAHANQTSGSEYGLISNNCEHYANEAKIGQSRSEQVEEVGEILNYDPEEGLTYDKIVQAYREIRWNMTHKK